MGSSSYELAYLGESRADSRRRVCGGHDRRCQPWLSCPRAFVRPYAPQSEAARELAGARFCTANGLLLLSVELIKASVSASASKRAIQLKFGGARYAVELFGGKFEAMDAGHVVLDEHGAEHVNQCVLCAYPVIDLIPTGVFPSLSERQNRGSKRSSGFRQQAAAALEQLGPPTGSMSVAVAELRADIRGLLKWNDHDSRLVLNFGRGAEGRD